MPASKLHHHQAPKQPPATRYGHSPNASLSPNLHHHDPHNTNTMFGLIAGMAFFLEAGNGANFALVPHVNPQANGVVSGMTGATGNLGGIIYAIVFRYNYTNYAKSFWIIGVMMIGMNLAVAWIRPVAKHQIGGR